MRKLKHFLK